MDVVVVVPEDPHAAARHNPAVASASARKRIPKCIRVLPLWLVLQPSSRIAAAMRGESAPVCRSYSHGLFGQHEFCCSGKKGVKSRYDFLPNIRSNSQGGQAPLWGTPSPCDACRRLGCGVMA